MRNNFDVVLTAVKNDGLAIEHADANLFQNKDVMVAACTQHGQTLKILDE